MEITQSVQQTRRQMKKKSNIQDLWDHIKQGHLHIIRVQKEMRGKGIGNVSEEIIADNFLSLNKEKDIHLQ